MEKTPLPASGLPALSAAMLAYHELKTSPSLIKASLKTSPSLSKAEKKNPPLPVASPMSSLGGCSDPGFLGSQTHPKLRGSSGIRKQALRLPKHRLIPGKPYPCSGDGCRLVFRSMKELLDHMRVHYRPTQSLEGKTFRCSTSNCQESFPNMQDLMDHMKVHYKIKRYFKCENCTSRFRTYRSLLKHLHVCSETTSPSPSLMAEKPLLPPTSGPEKEPPGKLLEELPHLQSVIQHTNKEVLLPPVAAEAASAVATNLLPSASLEAMPPPTPPAHPYPPLESSLFGPPASLARFTVPPHSSVPGPFLPYMYPSSYALSQASVQSRLRPYLPGPGLPVSNAVWKKSQGHSSNSRIVWQHTRGRYNCLQCTYSTPSREEMTQHIEDHRKNPSPLARLDGEMDFGVGLPSFHPKLTPDMENSLFSQI